MTESGRLEASPKYRADLAPFFRFAQNHCCNYSSEGPNGKRHYCWLNPPETKGLCVIPYGLACRWFAEAVLPLDQALWGEWNRVRQPEENADHSSQAGRQRLCPCGARFVSRGNRHRYCEKCAVARRLVALRLAKRRQRSQRS